MVLLNSSFPSAKTGIGAATVFNQVALFSLLLGIGKLVLFLMSGSIIILTSFLDSLSDACLSWFNGRVFLSSRNEPDREHPYGHGGFELFAGVIQGGLLTLFGAMVLLEVVRESWRSSRLDISPENFSDFLIASSVLLIAAASGFCCQWYLGRQQKIKKYASSMALEVDRAHYLGDFWTNLAGSLGLALAWWFEDPWLDRGFGAIGALLLVRSGYPILRKSFHQIAQEKLPDDMREEIVRVALAVDHRIAGIHRLRSRRIGPDLFTDFHLKLPDSMPLTEAHGIGERVAQSLRRKFERIDVIIYLDPRSEPDDDLWEPGKK